jgi:predicted dehydrogenase
VSSLAVYDRETGKAEQIAEQYGGRAYETIEELLDECDAVSICTPTTHHHAAAALAFDRGVHVLVEKPIAATPAEGEDLVDRAAGGGCTLQVGHIERFNGAFEAVSRLLHKPRFIESHRLATFTERGTDVSVVVDLMIHDIDLVLCILEGESITDLRASGAGVLTDSPDIVNARIEFSGGCVANITASRISREPMRKIRFFQENMYISADLGAKTVEAFEKSPEASLADIAANPLAFIRKVPAEVDKGEQLVKEIASFVSAVTGGSEPVVSGRDGLRALRVADEILRCTGAGGRNP